MPKIKEPDERSEPAELSIFIDLVNEFIKLNIDQVIETSELVSESLQHIRLELVKLPEHYGDNNLMSVFDETLKIENSFLKFAIDTRALDKARRIILIVLESLKLVLNEVGKLIIEGIQELFKIIDVICEK